MPTVMTPENVRSFAGVKIVDDNEATTQPGLFINIYGIGGGGKTTTLANVVKSPHGRPALLIGIDGSWTAVTHLRSEGLDITAVRTYAEVEAIRKKLKSGDHPYKSVITDNYSALLTLIVKKFAPTGMPEGNMALKIWGQVHTELMQYAVDDKDLSITQGLNMLSVMWEETEKDELTQEIRRKVNLSPKLSAAIPGMITLIGRLTVPGNKENGYVRKLSFAPSEKTDAKFRVSPTEALAKLPLEVFLRKDETFIADMLAALKDNVPFPVAKYAAPAK